MTTFTNLRGHTVLVNLDNVAFFAPHVNNLNDHTEITFANGGTLAVLGSVSSFAKALIPQAKAERAIEVKMVEPATKQPEVKSVSPAAKSEISK